MIVVQLSLGGINMKTCVMSFCNQKGGVGKTSTTALVSYNLAKMGYKCLTIDFDPQANLTSLFIKRQIVKFKLNILVDRKTHKGL